MYVVWLNALSCAQQKDGNAQICSNGNRQVEAAFTPNTMVRVLTVPSAPQGARTSEFGLIVVKGSSRRPTCPSSDVTRRVSAKPNSFGFRFTEIRTE